MIFYWSINSVPEVAALPKAQRDEMINEFHWRTTLWWANFVVGFPVAIGATYLINASGLALFQRSPLSECVAMGSFITIPGILLAHLYIAKSLPEIRKRIGGLCTNCGYDIRATPDRCPECGAVPVSPDAAATPAPYSSSSSNSSSS